MTIGFATQTGDRVAIREGVTLGREVSVEEDVLIYEGVTIGDGVRISGWQHRHPRHSVRR